ncbi:hypothetical protein EBS80_02990 [bacterium]|nr:hypothetical protein [bacterium]
MLNAISWQHALVLVASAISLTGGISYVRSTIAGRTKPNRVTWGLWALAPLIAVGAAASSHADPWAMARIFLAGFIPLLVFGASFVNKNSYWKLTTFDFLCGIWSLAALIAWLVADAPEVAILFAVLGDAFAAVPTIKKAWQHPETENGFNYLTSLASVLLVLPSIPVWNITNASFQVYLLAANAVLLFAVYRKRRRT